MVGRVMILLSRAAFNFERENRGNPSAMFSLRLVFGCPYGYRDCGANRRVYFSVFSYPGVCKSNFRLAFDCFGEFFGAPWSSMRISSLVVEYFRFANRRRVMAIRYFFFPSFIFVGIRRENNDGSLSYFFIMIRFFSMLYDAMEYNSYVVSEVFNRVSNFYRYDFPIYFYPFNVFFTPGSRLLFVRLFFCFFSDGENGLCYS